MPLPNLSLVTHGWLACLSGKIHPPSSSHVFRALNGRFYDFCRMRMMRAAAPKRDVVRARCSRPPNRPSISRPTATATVKTFLLSNHENFCSRRARRLAVPKVGRQDGLVEVGRLSVGRWVWRERERREKIGRSGGIQELLCSAIPRLFATCLSGFTP